MLNRTSSADLSRTLEAKSVRRPWNSALHPRDSKGRFIETGGVARLWSGTLARVVRALPRDRVLVQDRAPDGTYTGRRHSTSARWITMVARPDGSAPTANQQKVEAEDARREADDRRGLGLSRDDKGDPDTPDEPHGVDDEGNDIGDDDGDAPEDDDQDEPEDGHHDVDTEALPNRRAHSGARFEDTAAVRRHFLNLAQQPDANAPALRRLAGDEDLQITPSGGLVTTRDDATGRWYLTSTGTGGYLDVGDFSTRAEAEAAAEYINEHVRNGHIMPGEFNEPIDFSDPKIADKFPSWRSTKGEDAEQAIRRAVRDFHASHQGSNSPKAPASKKPRAQARGRFTTLQQARTNWTERAEALRATGSEQDQRTARDLDTLAKEQRLKLVGDGQFVTRREEGDWYLHATGTGQRMPWWFDRQSDAKDFAEHVIGILKDKDGNALDFSDPNFADDRRSWRSAKGRDYDQEWTAARALWDQQHPPKHSIATERLAETLRRRPFGDNEDQDPKAKTPTEPTPEAENSDEPDIPEYARAQSGGTEGTPPGGQPEPAPDPAVASQQDEAPEPEADGRPTGVPKDAEPVDGVPGYWATSWNPGPVTVYAPDGTQIASVAGGYSDRHATIDGVYVPIGSHANIADQIIARHHLATTNPDQADHVHLAWTTHKGKRILAVRGTIKNDARDDRAVGAAGKLAWSPIQKARVTGTQWKRETRDRKAADILAAFIQQGRNVHVTDEGRNSASTPDTTQLDEDAKMLRAMDDEVLRGKRDNLEIHVQIAKTPARKQRARAALQKVEAELERRRFAQDENTADKPEAPTASTQERAAALSDTDLAEAIRRSERDRGTYGPRRGDRLNEDEQALYADRRRRTAERLNQGRDPQNLSKEDLAARIKELEAQERAHKPSGAIHEEEYLAPERDLWNQVTERLAEAETEQQTRRLRAIQERPPVQDLDDDALEKEFLKLPIRLRRLGAEQNEILSARRHAVSEERQNRKAAVYRNGPDPAGLDDDDLNKAFKDLYKKRNLTSGREKEALQERLKALFEEQNRRGAEGREQTVNRAETPENPLISPYNIDVQVDGNSYGKVSYHEHDSPHEGGHKAGWNAQRERHGGIIGAFPSMTEALAAVVDSYDTDPATEAVRLYGSVRRVWVPKMFYELYRASRRADSFPSASKERQTLYDLFAGRGYGDWSASSNPITGKVSKGANIDVPEGLLSEFQRVTEELSRKMMLRASDRELDSSERSKARTRLASINAALHGIDAQRTAVRKDGGDDDRKVISREEIEAQQAALRAALGTDEGADGEHLQPDSQGPLGEVPSAGAGGDGRRADVLPEQGQGDRDGDSGGRGGAGGDRASGGGVRGEGRSDQADQSGRDRDGSAGSAAGAGAGGRGGADAESGDAGPDGDAGRGVRHVARRFRPNPADAATKGPLQRAAANVEAIRVLKRLEKENRPATEREKVTLARWTGWGSVPIMFASEPNEKEPRYQQGGARFGKFAQDHARWAEYRDLRIMLSDELTPLEWQQARRGTLSMHYTPQPVAEAMWDGLKAFGFEHGDVLEAGSGAGTFFGVAPEEARLTGIELDPTTARIAKAIYPDANVLNENFAETDAEPGTFDASIGNVPFASVPFGDKRYPAESLHNGFITKELALTRPGGITLLITSRHTLDSKGDKARKQIAKYGDLIGAVRLPSGVFNDAGTSVVTDVLVLRRRADGDEPGDTSWLNAPERKVGGTWEHVNAYFTQHPEHVLGELTTESSPYGPRLTVKGDPVKAADQLRAALKGIAAKATADGRGYAPHPDGDNRPPVLLQTAREKHANDWTGRLYEGDDGKLYQHVNGGNPVAVEPSDGRGDQLRALMQLRDVAAELRALDRKQAEDERAEKLRAQLRDLHTSYVEQYGPLSKPGQFRSMKTGTRGDGTEERTPTAWGYFRSDPDAGSVLALERWDADKQEPILSRVFEERAAARRQPLDRTDDPKTALSAVVAATGLVDIGEIARLLDMTPADAVRALGSEVFTDPRTGRLDMAGAYLSGPVRDKLEAARRAAEKDPAFAVNVAALEAVQPVDRTIGEFTPEMGAHWTPPELLQGFLREYLGDKTLRVAHDDRYGWMLYTGQVPKANNVLHGVAADEEKGTKGKTAVEIARSILGHGSLTIYRDDKRRDVDEETSRLVRQKADQMRSEYAKYATANADRLTRLTDSYNKIMNGHVVRSYDGMSPSLDGFTPDRTPHPWQLSGAARMQFERSVILAHEVGLGKTSTLVMGTQALKASRQIEKPYAVVPDHLAQQWYDEARFLYPNAEIHLITSGDLAEGRRDSTLEWLRANKPDLVIFTEPAFGSIKMSPEAQEEYEFRELEALREQLDRQYEDADNPDHPFIVAKIEQRIATVQNKISKNAAPMRTPGQTYWDDLGFDYAVIDEAHRYKGVGFRSREGGGDPASIRGIDLHQKLSDLHRRRGGRATVTLATGTPLSNSITEQFTMLALAAPWVLDSYKAGAPDLWAATFGRKTLRVENAPDGSGLRIVERFAEFHNRRAMKTMWGLVADTKRADDVGIPRPKVKGGGPNLVMVDPTKDQTARLKKLVARGRAIHNGDVDRSQDNMLAVAGEGTSVALDPRLVDAKAPAGNKLRAVAARHIERYHQHKDRVYKTHYSRDGTAPDHPTPGALQMIFLNEGVPGGNNRGSFDAYAELKQLMVAGGIPAEKIAFVQDHKKTGKPEELAELFRKARDGEIAVLIGSSSVAGTGMNTQNRMVSLTHVDLDWGAAQMEQRNGRILRYGNQNPEVEIDIFATKGSLDGWKAGFVAYKAEGLVDIQRPEMADSDTRDTVTELDIDYPDYETMEAEIGGNPYMSQLMKARRLLRDLEIDQHNEAAERVRRQEALADLQQELAATRDGIARREESLPRIRDVRGSFAMSLGGLPYTERTDAAAALHRQVTTHLLEHDRDGMSPWKILGQFGGLDIGVRTEKRPDGKLLAHVGFPDLARSDFERGPDDLKKRGAGSGMITRLTNALEKAPALQQADRARLPELDEQMALLQSAQAAADFTPQIEHARARANLLDDVVGRIADLDKLPEIDEDELDKKLTKAQRRAVINERREARVPLQGAVDAAVRMLDDFDRKFPQPERAESPEAPEERAPKQDPVRLSAEEVSQTLTRLRPEEDGINETTGQPDTAAGSGDGGESGSPPAPASGGEDSEENTGQPHPVPGDDVQQPDRAADEVDDTADEDSADTGNTVTLDPDEVAQQLDAIRPAGDKAPTSMTNQEIADEIVALMEREMADGELTGADRTRMVVLEAEKDRRAGRTPKPEPKKPVPTEPEGGLFDVDTPQPQGPVAAADPNNPLDRPDDAFGTPDMFAVHEGRDTSRLRPAQMLRPEELTEGDRYTDAEGRTHTVAEPPKRTGRGRIRIVTSDGAERFYTPDSELRLRYPDEEVIDDRDEQPVPGPRDTETADVGESPIPASPRSDGTTHDEAPESEVQGDEQPEGEGEQLQDGEDSDDDERSSEGSNDEQRRRDRGTDADAAGADSVPELGGGAPKPPGTNSDSGAQGEDRDAAGGRARRRREERGHSRGPGGPGGPRAPRPDLPHQPRTPADSSGGNGDRAANDSEAPDHTTPRTVADLRTTWRREDRLTGEENTPERRAFLARLAANPTLTLSSGGGLVTWTDDTATDGMRRWQFAQARNGGRFGNITLIAANPGDARELADLFELTPGADGQPVDWQQPLTPETITQWRDREGRTLPEALRAMRDLFQGGDEPETSAPGRAPIALPEDLTDLDDDDLAAAWGQGLSETDQMRVAAEMDRRDAADRRVRDVIPSTPAADAEEVRRRGEAMDTALGFGTTNVPRRPQTREERLQGEFQEVDEARYAAAVDATNGYFFSRTSKRLPPVSERDLFSGGNLSRFGRWREYASEELIEWFDNNGGRLTYNQWKQKRRANDKIDREQYEEEQRRAAATTDAATLGTASIPPVNIDDIDLPSFTLVPEPEEDANRRFGGADQVRALAERAELHPFADSGSFDVWMDGRRIGTVRNVHRSSPDRAPMWDARPLLTISHDHNSRSATRDLAVANLVVRAERNPADATAPNEDTWDAVKAHLAGRHPELPELPTKLSNDPAVQERYDQLVHLVESFRAQQSPSGNLAQDLTRARDEFEWLRATLAARGTRQDRDVLKDLERRSFFAEHLRAGFLPDGERDSTGVPGAEPDGSTPSVRATDPAAEKPSAAGNAADEMAAPANMPGPASNTPNAQGGRRNTTPDTARAPATNRDDPSVPANTPAAAPNAPDTGPAREPRPVPEPVRTPDSTEESVAAPESLPEPEPIGGQPAHWSSVDQLQPGDMARIDGTTHRGRAVTRAGYVLDTPERVTVTRRGRTEEMWRTTIGESPDGRTGNRGTVYTPLHASAARVEAPESSVPGAPATGAQGDVLNGDLPDTIATDTRDRGLFPGSHVTGSGDREGTVTGVTDTTVSVRWSDGDTDNGVAPTSLTITGTDDRRPAGWTSTGQRVRPGHIVSDDNGALLGPVDETNGDRITVTTAEGTITRDAADLRVVGEVRDTTPDTAPITGISEPTADEISKGDVVVLDLDGAPTTVEIQDTNRDGDRVTLDYVDTTTGELGTIDMDATAVVYRAEGPNGSAPDLGADDAPIADNELTVHEPLPTLDPVTEPTIDPDLTPADRDAIADTGTSPEDDPAAQQAAARLGADLPVTPEQAAALAAQLRANADPATPEGRAALRAADHLDRTAGRTAPEGLDRPRPSNAAQITEGDIIAMPDERHGDEIHVYRVIDVAEGPGGVRSLLLEDENRQWKRRIVHTAMPVWQLPEPATDTTDNDNAQGPASTATPRDPNPPIAAVRRQIVDDHSRTVAMRIIDEAVAGTKPPGDIHALREQIAQRLTPEALQGARNTARQDASAALDAAGITGRERAAVQQALRRARAKAHERTVRAALRTVNDLEPLPGESNEDLAQRAADLLRLIPEPVAAPSPSRRRDVPDEGGSPDAATHVDDAVTALLRQLEEAGADPGDAETLSRLLAAYLDATRHNAARRITRRAAASPGTAPRPGFLANVIDLLSRIARRLIELVKAAARKIAELWRENRDRISGLKRFLHRLVARVRNWPESRRLARLNAALDLPDVDGESLAARVSQWAGLLPERGRFALARRRVSWWRPTTWAQLAAGRLPGRVGETRWVPDRASDGGPGTTALRHLAALRAAGADVDRDVARRLADALGDDFGGDPHGALRDADEYVADTERRLLNLQAARGSTVLDLGIDVEIAAARREAAAARRAWADLRTRYAAAVPDAVAAALADVRDLGSQGSAGIVFGPDTTPDAERAVRNVQRLIPRDWLATPEGLTAVTGDAGRYEPGASRATVADLGDAGVGTAAHALAQHLATHLPDLDAAQRAFWFTRTHTGRPGARTLDLTALGRLLAQQQTQTDTGDSLARSLQAMFTGDWYLDDDMRSFLLGLLATR
ncbi:hypothetical protein [Streptomyces sp. NRRL S-920]|uniref:hypothetical protein n=1 Tax=Streptomyces sp. NRRL S-920 TaxID=1463921 RepID=UPI000560B936|nr:hypothetical protein [Streptomyces sp. NRRL S-920]